jgi:hypothetical protein
MTATRTGKTPPALAVGAVTVGRAAVTVVGVVAVGVVARIVNWKLAEG